MTALARTSAAAGAAALVGSLAGAGNSAWYAGLRKPRFQPPPVAFPLVWTPLYAAIAVSSARVLDAAADGPRREFTRALGTNLVLNAAWTWIFFRARAPLAATAECLVLSASSADLVRRAARVDCRAAAGLAPYAAWTAFATLLSAEVTRLNRARR